VEIINFFKFNTNYLHDTICGVYRLWDYIKRRYLNFVDDIVLQTLRISFKIDIKSPYIIFPEHGSIQKYVYDKSTVYDDRITKESTNIILYIFILFIFIFF